MNVVFSPVVIDVNSSTLKSIQMRSPVPIISEISLLIVCPGLRFLFMC